MRKKILISVVASVCVIGVTVLLHELGGKSESVSDFTAQNTTVHAQEMKFDIKQDIKNRLVDKKANDVVWTLSEDTEVNEEYLKLFNEKLHKLGYDFNLKFQYLDSEHYDAEVLEVLKSGYTDIAMGGQNGDEYSNVVSDLCRKNVFMDLSDMLNSNFGTDLKNEYEDVLWGSVTVDGHIYTVPNGIYNDGQYCIAINPKYISMEQLDTWDGSIEDIDNLLEVSAQKKDKNNKLKLPTPKRCVEP